MNMTQQEAIKISNNLMTEKFFTCLSRNDAGIMMMTMLPCFVLLEHKPLPSLTFPVLSQRFVEFLIRAFLVEESDIYPGGKKEP